MWQGAVRTANCVLVFTSLVIVLLQLVVLWTPEQLSQFTVLEAQKESTCSRRATARGPGQEVLSFVFYGPKNASRRYFQGIAENAALVPSLYPGWLMRVYHDLEVDDPDLSDLEASFPHLDLCSAMDIPRLGSLMETQPNAWRFLALCDPLVGKVMSRDLDSRLSQRQMHAVDEWISSGLRYHIMRDHPKHRVPILAGLWDVRLDLDAFDAVESPRRFCENLTRARTGPKLRDQRLLWKYVWPTIKGDVLQHDAYSCDYFRPYRNMRPWSTRRRTTEGLNFEGSRYGVDTKPMLAPCNPHCRPPDQPDWTSC